MVVVYSTTEVHPPLSNAILRLQPVFRMMLSEMLFCVTSVTGKDQSSERTNEFETFSKNELFVTDYKTQFQNYKHLLEMTSPHFRQLLIRPSMVSGLIAELRANLPMRSGYQGASNLHPILGLNTQRQMKCRLMCI